MLGALAGLPALPTLLDVTAAQAQTAAPLAVVERRAGETGDPRFHPRDHRRFKQDRFVPPEERIATFDQDGTLWVEHPMYTQVVYCLDRMPVVVKAKPELAQVEPFKTVLTGDFEEIAKLSMHDLEAIAVATLTGMSTSTTSTPK